MNETLGKDTLKRKKKLLVKYGFIKSVHRGKYTGKTLREMDKLVDAMESAEIDKICDIEIAEIANGNFQPTGYPGSLVRNHLVYETTNDPIEEVYWFERYMLKTDFGYTNFYKITDVFAATEHSSFWGVSEQRLGLQQDKASQYLKGISEMIKAMFQIVRELRIIDERLSYYDDISQDRKDAPASDFTLKGIYIDQVEGGAKNPSSVYGLASTVGFSLLPDIFFRTLVKDPNDIESQVEKMQFNEKVKEVLKRKLKQYLEWKKRTKAELKQRRIFTLKYLRQHYVTIKLYISWIKPYLRNVEKLQQDKEKLDSVDMVSFFEGSMAEVEFLATKKMGVMHSCLLLNFIFITKPSMSYQAEGYQRGPMHMGKAEITFRAYVWDELQINNFLKLTEEDSMQMLASIDKTLNESMDALGQELFNYLDASGEDMVGREETKPDSKAKIDIKSSFLDYLDPFLAIFRGAAEMGKSFGIGEVFSMGGTKGQAISDKMKRHQSKLKATKDVKLWVWMAYKNFKKAHRMITW